jgi:drug/metabolite transporter (DMT)-like permease
VLVLRRLPGTPAPVLTGARYVWGALFLAPALWLSPAGPAGVPLGEQLPILLFQGVVLSYAGTMFWYLAILRLDLARATAVVVPSIPVLSLGVSYLLLGETATARQLAGTLLTVAGVVAFARAPHAVPERERIPAPSAPIAVEVEPEEGGDAA